MKIVLGFLLFILSIVSYVFVLGEFYNWFLVPIGAPVIGLANIYGLSILLAFVTKPLNMKTNPRTFSEGVWIRISANIAVYIVGYIITLFM